MQTAVIWGNLAQMPTRVELQRYLPNSLLHAANSNNARRQQRRQCSILAHFLLAKLLEYFQQPLSLLQQIQRTPSGRPYFAAAPHIDFNISHSADWVAVVISVAEKSESAVAVAIDIESPQKTRNFNGLLRFYASQQEQDWFAAQPHLEAAFYRTWCLREAVLKSQGVGIVKLRSVIHRPDTLQIECAYAPQGKLFFTDELPFYLAYFLQQADEQLPQILVWQNDINSANFTKQFIYHVNKDNI
ncbi:4'-phosphopantetheinyl transferase superfamily protein [Pasteurellaceae bacterium USgator11]|nr:4'-phosphopantetheinyl transferase superfamily protein [Pasteurellaceae bacterium USgator41]TNG97003.1 4'-phosphopantetheinyl transferase superfamily protein [Pasteurellaceae bacterium UScroc12]TNG98390.1 4'-phosphopantetheinyl transferase superfamily protein [Pasteurellaceae bacterium UScroc31]TNH01424.1 4'-phosphopantetheinyl transferase superfamily protein [Pasteurellaceae bacterium USgator11]